MLLKEINHHAPFMDKVKTLAQRLTARDTCADPEIFTRGGPFLVTDEGGGPTPEKFQNYLFLGEIFKFQGGGGPDPRSPPLDPRMGQMTFPKKCVITTSSKNCL